MIDVFLNLFVRLFTISGAMRITPSVSQLEQGKDALLIHRDRTVEIESKEKLLVDLDFFFEGWLFHRRLLWLVRPVWRIR
jgi:hypothetical protein